MLDFLEPYVMTFVVMYGLAKAAFAVGLLVIAALALPACAMGD